MLRLPDGNISMSADWEDLDRKLRDGDGLNWTGDPRLWLGIGTVKDRRTKRVVGHRLEVWRDNEDGSTSIIGTWHPGELYRVLYDLAPMRLGAPGVTSVIDRIDAANEEFEKQRSQEFLDNMAPQVEKMAYDLMLAQGHAKNTFAVDGRAVTETPSTANIDVVRA